MRNGQVIGVTTAGGDAKFQFEISGVSPGTHTYGVWSSDSRSVRSLTNSFTVAVAGGVGTSISGIYLPPTIELDKSSVKRGDPLTIVGASAPSASVTVMVHSNQEILANLTADKSGLWRYVLDTISLEYGAHTAQARWKNDEGISPLSEAAPFTVGRENEEKKKTLCGPGGADQNCDGKVNLKDFSTLAYWYKRAYTADAKKVDVNNDGKIDLKDFSILAYYWTG